MTHMTTVDEALAVLSGALQEIREGAVQSTDAVAHTIKAAAEGVYSNTSPSHRASTGAPVYRFWNATDVLKNPGALQGGIGVTPGWGSALDRLVTYWFTGTPDEMDLLGVPYHLRFPYSGDVSLRVAAVIPPYYQHPTHLSMLDYDADVAAQVTLTGLGYHAAGEDLVWNGSGEPGAGLGSPYLTARPHNITCSHFTGLLLSGVPYHRSRYVQATNDVVRPSFSQGADFLWQAHRQAWGLASAGRLGVYRGQDHLREGDLLFYAGEDPEGSWTRQAAEGWAQTPYFGGVYHVAYYAGDGEILHSYAPTTRYGVMREPLSSLGAAAYVGRPGWSE